MSQLETEEGEAQGGPQSPDVLGEKEESTTERKNKEERKACRDRPCLPKGFMSTGGPEMVPQGTRGAREMAWGGRRASKGTHVCQGPKRQTA